MNRINKICTACLLSFVLLIYGFPAQAGTTTAQAQSLSLSPNIPIDIPITQQREKKLLNNNFPLLQRIFDVFSWQSFIAFNWPVDSEGNPLPEITDSGTPEWQTWKESLQVFRPDGGDPMQDTPRRCDNNPGNMRELYVTSSIFSNTVDQNIADEVDQAFTSPLYDQNGKEVRYEIFINDEEYNYIVDNKLYNLDGQIAYSQNSHLPVNFPTGDNATGEVGVIELKLAWKELNIDDRSLPHLDIPSRFYTETVLLPDLDDNGEPILDRNGNFKNCEEKQMGLVGMHISHKTKSSPQWIWATFEQVDNLDVNDLESVNGRPLYPLFHDYSAAGQTLPVNVPPIPRDIKTGKPDISGMKRTQVSRPIPIPKAKQQLNEQAQGILAAVSSPLQYYELIDTQWPTAPLPTDKCRFPTDSCYAAVPGNPSPDNLPEGITRKSTGSPAPVYLTNSIMETYFQTGNQEAHFQENGFPFDNTQVFGTESCMACHFSAGIATGYITKNTNGHSTKVPVFGGDLSADFSWLPQLKAQFMKRNSQ
ncbi:MAG: hypothetical protein F6K40_02210 [Okeania sp. SIO3I5]|uniref:hypothetical protein n=1 Tax=Okeania sp. SIO3I5 TaxID=2607805 RepID=UPI0013BB44A8|nr:hypothetical protein [Okeania sp. SIO3I5]NEQ35185.1 hypothetical protein [Okeania sp. SIO3I5]